MKTTFSPEFVKVFVTKTRKFRATISGPGKPTYEVTVGGNNWRLGLGKEHVEQVADQIKRLVKDINKEAQRLGVVAKGGQK